MQYLFLFIVLFLLAGCGTGERSTPVIQPTFTSLAVEVRTLVPAATVTLTPTPAAAELLSPTASATPDPSFGANPSGPAPLPQQGVKDCALTPGWVGCDLGATPIPGRMAIADAANLRILVLDLETGASWQVQSPPGRLSWSPDGSKLLVARRSEGGTSYQLFSADGTPLEAPATDEDLRWQPDGTLDSILAVHSAAGDIARLEYSPDQRWRLHVAGPEGMGSGQTFEIETQPTDLQYIPERWIEGQNKILARRFSASSASLLTGAELITIDTASGAVQPLEPPVPVDVSAQFALPPGEAAGLSGDQPAPIAMTALVGGGGRPVTTLALLNPITGQASYPIPEDVSARSPIWTPDGTGVLFDAAPREPVGAFTGPGIYIFYPRTGNGGRLTEPPQNMSDFWPQVTADGQTMLFLRVGSLPSGELRLDVMAMRLSDRSTWTVVRAFPIPGSDNVLILPWDSYLAFGVK